MVGRLVARFYAMRTALRDDLQRADPKRPVIQEIQNLPLSFRRVFKIRRFDPRSIFSNLRKLADNYYILNDWITNAYGILLEFWGELPAKKQGRLLERVHQTENKVVQKYVDPGCPIIPRIDASLADAQLSRQQLGKILFLDTQGFGDPVTFAGTPLERRLEQVARSYGSRLLPRHFVLARMSREGFCPVLVTTNFDLLLEGALRLSGFRLQVAEGASEQEFMPPNRPRPAEAAVITRPEEFFEGTEGFDNVMLLKIHGCVRAYPGLRQSGSAGAWKRYLRSVVFTFREIQNWREDRWSRDYLRTLLRTRTMVFCGYSAADPVIHDTHRTVYEEMAKYRVEQAAWMEPESPNSQAMEPRECNPDFARAFFLGDCRSQEFHSIEILRASSRASDSREPDLTSHPNYLGFNFRHTGRFPDLDELLQWLYHRVIRIRQKVALQNHLRRTIASAYGHPVPESQINRLVERFEELSKKETDRAELWSRHLRSRLEFQSCISWTYHFYAGLLRELTFLEAVQQQDGTTLPQLYNVSHPLWYYPGSERPDWTAWTAVVELAVRRLVAYIFGQPVWRSSF